MKTLERVSPNIIEEIDKPRIGVLIEVTPADFVGNRYTNCEDCAISRAIKRVCKDGTVFSVDPRNVTLRSGRRHDVSLPKDSDRMAQEGFAGGPQSFSFYLDIPQEFLK